MIKKEDVKEMNKGCRGSATPGSISSTGGPGERRGLGRELGRTSSFGVKLVCSLRSTNLDGQPSGPDAGRSLCNAGARRLGLVTAVWRML